MKKETFSIIRNNTCIGLEELFKTGTDGFDTHTDAAYLIRRLGPRPAGPRGLGRDNGASTFLGCAASIRKSSVRSLKSSISS